jgi:hypothetical protein
VGCVGSKEVGGPQAASAIAMRVQAKKVAAGILESKTTLGGVDEERMDVDEEHNVHPLPVSHHLSRSMDCVMKSHSGSPPANVALSKYPLLTDLDTETMQMAIQRLFDLSKNLEDSAFRNFVHALCKFG